MIRLGQVFLTEENHMLMPAGVIKSSDNHVTFNHWVTGSNPVPLTILRVSELLGDVTCEDMGRYHANHLPFIFLWYMFSSHQQHHCNQANI